MTINDKATIDTLQRYLEKRKLHVERQPDGLKVTQGSGILAQSAVINADDLLQSAPSDEVACRRHLQAWTAGVKHVLLEPSRSKADEWSFVDSAGRLLPLIMPRTYLQGVEAAAGHPPWSEPFVDDLHLLFLIRLDRGLRVLTTDQTTRWGVSDDRIRSAARSLLFHRTRDLSFKDVEDFSGVQRLKAGDGHDAARCQVVADAFFSEVGSGFRFSIPSPDHFLCTFGDDDHQLHQATNTIYGDVDLPLSPRIFEFRTGTVTPVEETPS